MHIVQTTTLCLLLLSGTVMGQLAFSFGSAGSEYGKASTTDNDTNYICAALFAQTVNVHPTATYNLVSRGGIDVALLKYNKTGELLWAKRFGGITSTDAPHAVETDSVGNIYVAGYFGIGGSATPVSADFNPNGGGTLTTKSGFDIYLAKYDKNGNYIWALSLGNSAGNTEERAWDIAVDKSGSVYLSGACYGTIDFNPLGISNVKTINGNQAGLFIAKYNSNGINQWAIPISANDTSVFYEAYTTVDLDANNNILFAGNFRGNNVNFNPTGTTTLSSAGATDIFFASYSVNGELNWVNRIGGNQQDIISPGAMRIDIFGNIFFTGRIAGIVDFDPSICTTNVSSASLFLASYTNSGLLRFAFGMTSNAGDGGHRVGFDSEHNVYVTGWMNGTVNFNPTGTANITATSSTADVFLAKYTNTGNYLWAFHFGAANATDQNICAGLSIDKQDNIFLTGQFSGSNADIDPGTGTRYITAVGGNDCFVVKYTKDGSIWSGTTGLKYQAKESADNVQLKSYPNPFRNRVNIRYSVPELRHVKVSLVDLRGIELATLVDEVKPPGSYNEVFDSKGLPSGMYICRIASETFSVQNKILLIK